MKELFLTRGKIALVDDEDFGLISKHKWFALQAKPGFFYAARKISVDGRDKMLLLHRFLMNPKADEIVDHINRNTLDCQRLNLRIGTHTLNHANRRKSEGKSSKYKGVYYSKALTHDRRWCSSIMKDGERIMLGNFLTEIEAATAYDTSAESLFGEFSLTNKNLYPEDFKEFKND